MSRTWIAIICVALLVVIAASWVFFATAGGPWLAGILSSMAQTANPGWSARLNRLSLAVNPYDVSVRLALCQLYRAYGREDQARALLQDGVEHYATGPDLYLALAALYVDGGSLDEACRLLDSAPDGYLSRRISVLRPDNAVAPPSGTYAAGRRFSLIGGEGTPWYQLNNGSWTLYGAPLELMNGKHILRVVTLDKNSIPSPVTEYRYTVESIRSASFECYTIRCPFCGKSWPQTAE